MINKIKNNKVIQTNDLFKTIKQIKSLNKIIITPLTKIEEILNFNSTNPFFKMIQEKFPNIIEDIVSKEKIDDFSNQINDIISKSLIDFDFPINKLFKIFFKINKEIEIEEVLTYIFDIYDKYSLKIINIYLIGFDEFLKKQILNEKTNINLIAITNNFKNIVNWNNIEQLIIHKQKEFIEIYDENMLLSYLEHQAKTHLNIKDLNNYFNNEESFNSYLIDRAIKKI